MQQNEKLTSKELMYRAISKDEKGSGKKKSKKNQRKFAFSILLALQLSALLAKSDFSICQLREIILGICFLYLKFIYSEKTSRFLEIPLLVLMLLSNVKTKRKISSNFCGFLRKPQLQVKISNVRLRKKVSNCYLGKQKILS